MTERMLLDGLKTSGLAGSGGKIIMALCLSLTPPPYLSRGVHGASFHVSYAAWDISEPPGLKVARIWVYQLTAGSSRWKRWGLEIRCCR